MTALQGPRQQGVLHAGAGGRALQLQRLRQHLQLQATPRSAGSSWTAYATGCWRCTWTASGLDLASIMTRAPSVWHRDADGDAATLHCAEPPASAAAAATAAPVPARSPLASADAPPKTPPDPLRGEQQYAPLQLPFLFLREGWQYRPGTGHGNLCQGVPVPSCSVADLMPNGPGVPTGTPLSDPALGGDDQRGPGAARHQADRGGLGLRRPEPGRRIPALRRPLVPSGTAHFRDTARMFVKVGNPVPPTVHRKGRCPPCPFQSSQP